MSAGGASSAGSRRRAARAPELQELPDFCSRPRCHREFRQSVGRGRRQEYCSEVCRRTAEKEIRQLRSQLQHFERLVDELRINVAAFGRSAQSDVEPVSGQSLDARRAAEDALVRAAGVLAFVEQSPEPLAGELRALYAAVAPMFGR